MKIAIIYESKTGNTKQIANSMRYYFEKDHNVIFESVDKALENNTKDKEFDLYLLGSWTNKGDCGDLMKQFCKELNDKKIAIFGTAGFGGSQDYYKSLADRFFSSLSSDNKLLGYFYCQGKMPIGIRERYVSMLKVHPEDKKLEVNIENFDEAQSHPDNEDLDNAKIFAREILEKLN